MAGDREFVLLERNRGKGTIHFDNAELLAEGDSLEELIETVSVKLGTDHDLGDERELKP